jgi:predicted dehydrogenase
MAEKTLRVLVVGLGNTGMAHAHSYDTIEGYEIAGLCARSIASRHDLPPHWADIPRFADFGEALAAVRPDVVSINTYPDTHPEFAIRAFAAGAHVFVEKPLGETIAEAERVVAAAERSGGKMVIGYGARHSPAWRKLVEIVGTLGKPLVMRMNLNQQSFASAWEVHRNLLKSCSPIVDCGVHYVDLMCLMTGARPVSVHAIGARLSDQIAPDMYNYGQLQVRFDDGSVGWYEAAWGPMISEAAYFTKDVMGPNGSVTILPIEPRRYAPGATTTVSSDMETHSSGRVLRLHRAALGANGALVHGTEDVEITDPADHHGISRREQQWLLDAIRRDLDLRKHWADAINSMRIVHAADESVRTGKVVAL